MPIKSPEQYSDTLVMRINELYHDAITDYYQGMHQENLGVEGRRWREIAGRLFGSEEPMTVVDIGTGLGMVPLSIAPFMKRTDTLIGCDISSEMLAAARRHLEQANVEPRFELVKIEGSMPLHLPFDDASADVVTMNSVLHHIKDTEGFLAEIDRVLKPGGLLVIGHEPNRRFRQRRFLWGNYLFLRALFSPKWALTSRTSRKLGIYRVAMGVFHRLFPERGRKANAMVDSINSKLMAEGLIRQPMALDELAEVTDIWDRRGFDPTSLIDQYTVVHLETYHHLLQLTIDRGGNRLVRSYDAFLARRYPDEGGTFFLALRKPQ